MANFFDLPLELERAIYEMAMEDVHMELMMVPSNQRHFLRPGILLANRRHQHEIRTAVFKHTTVGVRIGWQMSAMFVQESYMLRV
jgi:hypothetical protein